MSYPLGKQVHLFVDLTFITLWVNNGFRRTGVSPRLSYPATTGRIKHEVPGRTRHTRVEPRWLLWQAPFSDRRREVVKLPVANG